MSEYDTGTRRDLRDLNDPSDRSDLPHPEDPEADADDAQLQDELLEQRFPHSPPRRVRRGRYRRWIALLLALIVVAGGGYLAVGYLKPALSQLRASDDYSGNGSGTATVRVLQGDSGEAIANKLYAAGVVKTAKAFARVAATSSAAGSIQPGTYTLHKKMSASAALAMLVDPGNLKVVKVTIPEGLWKAEIVRILAKASHRPVSAYTKVLAKPARLGLPAVARGHVDGWLFPATYSFDPSAGAFDQLSQLISTARTELARAKVRPPAQERILTMASLVEGEAARAVDRPKVARVILNRLSAHKPLAFDSTVHYVFQARGKVTTTNAQRASRSRYNTYLHRGLPPGPINSPGMAAIQAALHPAKGSWMFFTTVNPATGQTRFATTYAQQLIYQRQFQHWCASHKGC